MNRSRLIPALERSRNLLLAFSLALAGLTAVAQDDPPTRVARLNLAQGTVSQLPQGEADWSAVEINRPLTTGDRLWTEPGARAELHTGSTAIRIDGQSLLEISALDDNTARLTLSQGSLNLRVRNLYPGEQMEIDTPNLALTVQQPGSYHLEVDPASGITRVAVRYGNATVYGENAEAMPLSANSQLLSFAGRNLAQSAPPAGWRNDAFDLWADARDKAEDQSVSARYVSREIPGYQQLDSYGDWRNDATYGAVWIPRVTVAQWAPYRYGQWRWIAPWGWTWVDDAPWGFAPFHYGRWAQVGPQWAWVPGPRAPRPVYSPALVGFLGNQPGRSNWNLAAGPDQRGGPGIGWFPLAPGEAWRPGYRASPSYLSGINRGAPRGDDRARNGDRPGAYLFQGRPGAVTAVPEADFGRGPAWRPNRPRLQESDLAGTQVLPTPPMQHDRPNLLGGRRPESNQQPVPQPPGRPLQGMVDPSLPGVLRRPAETRIEVPRDGRRDQPSAPAPSTPSQPVNNGQFAPPANDRQNSGPLFRNQLEQRQQAERDRARAQPEAAPRQPQREEPPVQRAMPQPQVQAPQAIPRPDLLHREQQGQQERVQREQAQREQQNQQREQAVREQQQREQQQRAQQAQPSQQAQPAQQQQRPQILQPRFGAQPQAQPNPNDQRNQEKPREQR